MNSRKIEQLYKSHSENTAPDMDALWQRIESNLEEKNEQKITSKPIRRNISFTKKTAVAAACIAALVIAPIAVRNMDISNADMAADSASTAEAPILDGAANEAAGAVPDDYFFDNGEIDSEAAEENFAEATIAEDMPAMEEATGSTMQTIRYEDLVLNPHMTIVTHSGETDGDDFFVEECVLVETDIIVNAYVDYVYSNGDGAMCYEITADNIETGETEPLVLTSRTPYVMLEDRCYVLPLKADGEVYRLAFENAPQIERTLDGGYIFHNGWECLNEDALDVIYPQRSVDDFFYDRMKFSYGSLDNLIERWHEVKD